MPPSPSSSRYQSEKATYTLGPPAIPDLHLVPIVTSPPCDNGDHTNLTTFRTPYQPMTEYHQMGPVDATSPSWPPNLLSPPSRRQLNFIAGMGVDAFHAPLDHTPEYNTGLPPTISTSPGLTTQPTRLLLTRQLCTESTYNSMYMDFETPPPDDIDSGYFGSDIEPEVACNYGALLGADVGISGPECPHDSLVFHSSQTDDDYFKYGLEGATGREDASDICTMGSFDPTYPARQVATPANQRAAEARRKGHAKYLCRLCGQGVTAKHNYINHMNAHLGIKPHSCHICKKAFTTRHTCLRHLMTVHKCQTSK